MLMVEAKGLSKRTRVCRASINTGCLVSNSLLNKQTIQQVEQIIPAKPKKGECMAIFLVLLIGLPVVSISTQRGRIPSEQGKIVCFLQYQVQ